MLIMLLFLFVYRTTVYGDYQCSVKDSKEIALIPKPTGDPIKGSRDLRDAMLLLHMKSRAVMETEEEKKLEFYKFNPGENLDKILKPEFLPVEIQSIFKKKQAWYPYFVKRKLQKKGRFDTAVARYSTKGYIIQVIETRAGTEIFVANVEKPLETALSAMTEGVPECFFRVFNKDLFEDTKQINGGEAIFPDGEILRMCSVSRPSAFINELYIPHFGVSWTTRVMVLRFPKDYHQAANPYVMIEQPMFIKNDQPQPYEKELSELEKLSLEGPIAAEKVAALLRKALSEIPDNPENRQRQILADLLRHENRFRLLRDGYAILTDMVKRVANEDQSLRHKCWSAAASVMPTMGSLRSEAKELARAIFGSMAISGKPEDFTLMKKFVLDPKFADSVKDGMNCLAKAKHICNDYNNVSLQCKELIEEIDQLTNTLPERPDPNANLEQWTSWKARDCETRKHRIVAIEKLEKENLLAETLKPYIEMKLEDIEKCFYYARLGEANWFEGKLYSMMEEGSPLEKYLATELFWSLNIYHVNTHSMHLSEVDIQQIADFELSRKTQPEAGRLLAGAIRSGGLSLDSKAKWSTWILQNVNSNGEGYKWVVAKNQTTSNIGKVFQFAGKCIDGKELYSEQLKGNVVLLDFWAFWCGYCLAEIPDLKELNKKYYNQGLRIIGVFNDYHIEQLKEYVCKHKINWPQLVEQNANESSFMHPLAKRCGFTGLPRYLLLDRDGKLAATSVRLEHLEPRILELLGRK